MALADVPRDGKSQGEIVLHTQDVAVVAPDGSILEGLIAEVPCLAEAAVIGVKDAKWGERPMAFVVCKPEAGVKPEAARVSADFFFSRFSTTASGCTCLRANRSRLGMTDCAIFYSHALDQEPGLGSGLDPESALVGPPSPSAGARA